MTKHALLCIVSFSALALTRHECVAQAVAPSITGTWQATTGVTFAPWTIELTQQGAEVTGTIRQAGGITNPGVLREGVVQGTTVSFKTDSPQGGRTITFVGTIIGDSIMFNRSVEDPGHTVGGPGVFGATGAAQFTVRRGTPSPAAGRESGTATTDAPHKDVSYRGFVIDITDVASAPDRDSVLATVRGQLDLVEGVRFSEAARRLLKSIPLVMVASSGSAAYGNGKVVIPLHSSSPYDDKHPILLHELCHAYHDKQLADGFRNTEVLTLYQAARDGGRFPANSYMLSKPGEYFAMMASVYLYGSAAREPFTRDAIKEKQPDMYRFLLKEFGAM